MARKGKTVIHNRPLLVNPKRVEKGGEATLNNPTPKTVKKGE